MKTLQDKQFELLEQLVSKSVENNCGYNNCGDESVAQDDAGTQICEAHYKKLND